MAKFRKKPVVIEAEQYQAGLEDGWVYEDQLPILTDEQYGAMFPVSQVIDGVRMFPTINTLEGPHFISDKDWIITGVEGERYPCKVRIFEATYEPASE